MSNILEISVRSDLGGGPKHLLDLLKYNSSNHKLYSAIPYGHEFTEKIKEHSVDTIEIPHRKFSFISFYKVYKFCRKNKITTIHSHGRGAGYYSRVFKLLGFKIVHTLHGVHIEDTIVNRLKFFFDRILVPLTDHFICVSEGEKKDALKAKVINSNRSSVILNGVHIHSFRPSNDKVQSIGMLGRLCYQKGYDKLIEYIDSYLEYNTENEFSIFIAGDGDDKEKLEEQLAQTQHAKKRITFIGKTLEPDKFISHHDGFLSTARFEGLPLSILEAISLSKPCIVSNVVGNNDIIDNNTGLLYDHDDQESFNNAFNTFLTTDLSQRINNSRKKLEERFDIRDQVKNTVSLY